MKKLYPYQQKAVRYIQTRKNGALFMEPRLGKTLTVIRSLNMMPGRKLVVCPKPVIDVWLEQLKNDGIKDCYGFSSSKVKTAEDVEADWLVCNYEAIKKLKIKVDWIIADESTAIKSPKAQITKLFLRSFIFENKLVLSGNPAPNHELEYICQMIFLFGECMGARNYWEFRAKYCFSDFAGHKWWLKPCVKDKFKKWLQERCFFLTRKQVGVENRKVYEKRMVEMPPHLKKHYSEMEDLFLTTTPSGLEVETKSALAQRNYLCQLAGGCLSKELFSDFKLKELKYLLDGELKGEPILIWAAFLFEIDQILKLIPEAKEISGRNPKEREQIRKDFQDGRINIVVIQSSTGSLGLDFSRSSTCIYYSSTDSVEDRHQSEHRIEANWKKDILLFIDLLTKDSIDEDKHKALKQKKKQSNYYMQVVENMRKRRG